MFRFIVLLASCLLMPVQGTESKPDVISFALIQVPGVMQHDSPHAPYNKLLAHIADKSKLTITSAFYPYYRAEMLMQRKMADCVFPVVKGEARKDFETIYSDTINVVSVYLFSLQSKFKSFADIPDKTVVYLEDYDFGYWGLDGKEKVNLVAVGTQDSALNVLKNGRAAAYMDYFPDLKLSLSDEDFSSLQFSQAHPIRSFEDSIECFTSEKNQAFMGWFNAELQALKASGEMQKLLGDYYNNPQK